MFWPQQKAIILNPAQILFRLWNDRKLVKSSEIVIEILFSWDSASTSFCEHFKILYRMQKDHFFWDSNSSDFSEYQSPPSPSLCCQLRCWLYYLMCSNTPERPGWTLALKLDWHLTWEPGGSLTDWLDDKIHHHRGECWLKHSYWFSPLMWIIANQKRENSR